RMSADDARADPRRHYLRSAVTGDEVEMIDAPERPLLLAPGDVLLVVNRQQLGRGRLGPLGSRAPRGQAAALQASGNVLEPLGRLGMGARVVIEKP
ncbi:MAG TPA: hypothetical protein PKC18_12870, partial [Lacipirellulaceae bacterium]|nr:hypothetical protein [Lacipirellulaceae bacterium]